MPGGRCFIPSSLEFHVAFSVYFWELLSLRASPGIAQRPSQCNIKTLNSDPRVEDEMVGWHDQLDGHEFEQTPEDGEGQGSLECCRTWGRKESDTTERLNNNKLSSSLNIILPQPGPLSPSEIWSMEAGGGQLLLSLPSCSLACLPSWPLRGGKEERLYGGR